MEHIELDAVIDEFDEAERMPIKPDVKPLSITHIFDENMSVKWNREQVEEHNKNLGIMRSEMMQAKYRAREKEYNKNWEKYNSHLSSKSLFK